MKRLLFLTMSAMLLVGCNGNKEPREIKPESNQDESSETEQEAADLKAANESFKSESVEHNYLSFFRDEVPVNSKVKFTGEVFVVGKEGFGGEFGLKQNLDGTTDGVLKVENMNIGIPVDIIEGKKLTVYGTYDGKDDIGAPVIKAILIEE